jgi:hypothetical protein
VGTARHWRAGSIPRSSVSEWCIRAEPRQLRMGQRLKNGGHLRRLHVVLTSTTLVRYRRTIRPAAHKTGVVPQRHRAAITAKRCRISPYLIKAAPLRSAATARSARRSYLRPACADAPSPEPGSRSTSCLIPGFRLSGVARNPSRALRVACGHSRLNPAERRRSWQLSGMRLGAGPLARKCNIDQAK